MTHGQFATIFFILAVFIRLISVRISARNAAQLLKEGGQEYGTANSTVLAVCHVAFYCVAYLEALTASAPPASFFLIGISIYFFGIVNLMAVMQVLGRFWSVRLIVASDHQLVNNWYYRLVKHPNYLLNILPELIGFAFTIGAIQTLKFGIPIYLAPLLLRVIQEERVMRQKFATY